MGTFVFLVDGGKFFSGWWESKLHMKITVYTWCLLKPTPLGYKLMLNNEQ